jgi:hypothetical protein
LIVIEDFPLMQFAVDFIEDAQEFLSIANRLGTAYVDSLLEQTRGLEV